MMRDWAVSFLAAAALVGTVIWCIKIFIGVFYVG
jgi:hypothetical protein